MIDKKQLLKNDLSGINQYLLENNTRQVEAICDFLQGKFPLMLVNGFMGSGKTQIVEHVLAHFDGIKLNYNCFETTILDDILLAFFEEFKKLTALELISAPKVKSENFTQKINAYFQSIEKPIVVVLNSFEEILKSNKPEILGFIKHLSEIKNIKVIIVARNFDYEEFSIPYQKVTVLALEKGIYEKYLRSMEQKHIGPLTDELYKLSRGYFFYVTLTLKIMKLRNLTMIEFLDGYGKSFLTFNDFILREALALVDPVSGHLFRFLTIIRHPVSVKLLKTLRLYDDEKVLFFTNNLVLSRFGEYIYLKDYYKVIAENSIPENVAVKIHKGCVDLYNTQLPLKPLERDLVISRQTMRSEIEYHSTFLPKKPILPTAKKIEYKEYSERAKDIKEETIEQKEEKDEKIKSMSFIFDDDELGVLDKIADSIKSFMTFTDKRAKEDSEESKLTLRELINRAKKAQSEFDFKHAVSLYQKALLVKNDDDYYTWLPLIYTGLATNYQKLSDWFNAQKYYEMAEDFYTTTGDIEKINETRYNIANIFYMTFKKDNAREILQEIEKQHVSDELMIKTLNLLANLTSDSKQAYEYYKRAIDYDLTNINKSVLSELYFKFALANEDMDDEKAAVKYYKKCIELGTTEHLADALSNIAQLYDDIGETDFAVKYYHESLKADEKAKNLNGIYTSSMKLAEIYAAKDPQKAVEYYTKALELAKEMNEAFYILSSATALGDFYFNRREKQLALEHYKIAQSYATKENADKIAQRIAGLDD